MESKRIQRKRTAGWGKPDGCVIVDRTSNLGNPFTVAQLTDIGYDEPAAREMVVAEFGRWLRGSRANWESDRGDQQREKILARLPELRGMDLACFCAPGELCHGDTLLEWAALSPLALEVRIASARARVDHAREARGEDPMYDADELAAVLTRDVTIHCLVDVIPGDLPGARWAGLPQRWTNTDWNYHLRVQRLHAQVVTARLVEILA
ncbi:DUF4326 domain-containing protein [Kitasatospora sp. NPDC088134]|uniref:DUF4326 domain-containing protein n=1 Tax=Kitasatospora sp. NPDC088134 TaxID=3364071 RepID=UPI00381DEEE4